MAKVVGIDLGTTNSCIAVSVNRIRIKGNRLLTYPPGVLTEWHEEMAAMLTAEGRGGFWQKFCLALSAFNIE